MALFGKKQKNLAGMPGVIHGEDEVLGYLDEVIRQRTPLSIDTKGKHWECSLYSFDIKKKEMRIEDVIGLSEYEKKPVLCGFTLDSTWFVFTSNVKMGKGKPYLTLPVAIQHKERRKKPRISLSTRENVKVTALEGLGAGLGITGMAVEVSEDTITTTIERCLMLENEKKVNPRTDLLKQGTKLMVLKVTGMPGVPTFQIEGAVIRITQRGGWRLVVKMQKLPKKFQEAIGKTVKSRSMPYKPTKRSYQRRLDFEKERQQDEESQDSNSNANGNDFNMAARKEGKITFTKEVENPVEKLAPGVPSSTGMAPPPPPPPPAPEPSPPGPQATAPTAPPKPPPKPVSKDPVLLSIGESLKEKLAFLNNVDGYKWVHVDSPLKIIKTLNDSKTTAILTTLNFRKQSMLDYIEKISGMGVLEGVQVILISEERIAPKDLIRCRMLGIQHTFSLPIESPDELMDVIEESA